MAIRNIRKEEDPILKKNSKEVQVVDEKIIELLDDMAQTMEKANGIGLAAVQVGVLKRIFLVDIGEGLLEFINPVMLKTEGEQLEIEGCLSIPSVWGEVKRPSMVVVEAQNRQGETFTLEAKDLLARAICHELDHLDGILFTTKVTRFVKPEEWED